MAEAPKQPGNKENLDAPPKTDSDRIVDPRDLVRTSGIPDNPKELLSNPGFAPQMIDQSADNLRSDLREEE